MAKLRCDEVVDDMGDRLAHEGWSSVAKADFWRRQIEVGGRDVVRVAEEADTSGADRGIAWVGGRPAGGDGQAPIEAVGDVAAAGYNLLLGRSATDTSAVGTDRVRGLRPLPGVGRPATRWPTGCAARSARSRSAPARGAARWRARPGSGSRRCTAPSGARSRTSSARSCRPTRCRARRCSTRSPAAAGSGSRAGCSRPSARSRARPTSPTGSRASSRSGGCSSRPRWRAGRCSPACASRTSQGNEAALEQAERAVDELDREIRQMELELRVKAVIASNSSVAVLRRASLRRRVPVFEASPGGTLREGAPE